MYDLPFVALIYDLIRSWCRAMPVCARGFTRYAGLSPCPAASNGGPCLFFAAPGFKPSERFLSTNCGRPIFNN